MTEYWDLYDKNCNKTGERIKRGDPIPEGSHNICVEIWVLNKKDEVLLTQRHPDKVGGLTWECSGGGVQAGEGFLEAAQRELGEETGIHVKKEEIHYLGTFVGNDWIMKTFIYFWEKEEYPCLKLQKEEVVDAKWVKVDKLTEMDRIFSKKVERFFEYYPEILRLKTTK